MTNLINLAFNYLRHALLFIAVAFLIVGPSTSATTLSFNESNASINPSMSPIPAKWEYETKPGYEIQTMGYTGMDWVNCVLDGVTPIPKCNLLKEIACNALGTLTWVLGFATVLKNVAGRLLKKGWKEGLKEMKDKGDEVVTIGIGPFTKSFTIPWGKIATWLETNRWSSAITGIIMMSIDTLVTRACKCWIC